MPIEILPKLYGKDHKIIITELLTLKSNSGSKICKDLLEGEVGGELKNLNDIQTLTCNTIRFLIRTWSFKPDYASVWFKSLLTQVQY